MTSACRPCYTTYALVQYPIKHIVYPRQIDDCDSYGLHAGDQRQVLLWKSWTPYNQTVWVSWLCCVIRGSKNNSRIPTHASTEDGSIALPIADGSFLSVFLSIQSALHGLHILAISLLGIFKQKFILTKLKRKYNSGVVNITFSKGPSQY